MIHRMVSLWLKVNEIRLPVNLYTEQTNERVKVLLSISGSENLAIKRKRETEILAERKREYFGNVFSKL